VIQALGVCKRLHMRILKLNKLISDTDCTGCTRADERVSILVILRDPLFEND